ncbi:MAG TPA: response regulator [Pyrinomonadaceae bacterium]|nr:response regulator [Pyrinomonadaceae bacterium]
MNEEERIHVLYIDDNSDSFEMIKVLLGFSRIDLASASNATDALAHAKANRFDLYLLDSGLPDGNGLNLCRTLREVDPDTPVLFYSGHAHPEEIQMGMAAGANGYIIKPHSDKLAETIIGLVAGRRENAAGSKLLPVVAATAKVRGPRAFSPDH